MRQIKREREDQKGAALAHLVDAGELETEAVKSNSGERFRRNEGAVDGEKGGNERGGHGGSGEGLGVNRGGSGALGEWRSWA